MRKEIPVNKDWDEPFIDYDGQVLLIERDENGNDARFQFDGTSCLQGYVTGFVVDSFKTKSKWFSEKWWYRKTTWFQDEGLLYFTIEPFDKDPGMLILDWGRPDTWEAMRKEVRPKARPSDKCLKAVLKEASSKLGIELEFDGDDTDYGKGWYEAYVPVKHKNKQYLLTWENCD